MTQRLSHYRVTQGLSPSLSILMQRISDAEGAVARHPAGLAGVHDDISDLVRVCGGDIRAAVNQLQGWFVQQPIEPTLFAGWRLR